jgi:hypothetical protein
MLMKIIPHVVDTCVVNKLVWGYNLIQLFYLYFQVYIENDFKELNVCIQYPPTHKRGVLGKNLAPRGSCNVGHHAPSSLHGSPSRTSTLSTPTLRKKRLKNAQLSHNVHAGTGTKNLSSPKSNKKVFVLHAD